MKWERVKLCAIICWKIYFCVTELRHWDLPKELFGHPYPSPVQMPHRQWFADVMVSDWTALWIESSSASQTLRYRCRENVRAHVSVCVCNTSSNVLQSPCVFQVSMMPSSTSWLLSCSGWGAGHAHPGTLLCAPRTMVSPCRWKVLNADLSLIPNILSLDYLFARFGKTGGLGWKTRVALPPRWRDLGEEHSALLWILQGAVLRFIFRENAAVAG